MISPIKVQAIVHEMPAMQGEIFRCDQGYNECDPSHCSFYSYGKAWDFNLSSTTGNDDLGFPIVASAAGRVTYAQNYRPAENDEWGNCVVILYDNEPQGYSGLYAHLNEIFIEVGEHVERGQVIGTIGDGDENYLSHLHYQLQDGDNPDAPSASGLFSDIGLPTSPNTYTSLNDNIFVLEENVRNLEGNRNGNIIWWPGEWNTDDRYDNSYAKRCYLQNYRICEDNDDEKPIINQPQASSLQDPDNKKNQRTSSFSATSSIPTDPCTNHAIVYDALGGARKAYTLKSAIWSIWAGQDGSQGPLGMPITNQYYYGGTVRQDFQKGYIEGGVVYSPEAGFMPGEDDNSWNNQYSYLFALAYERNGGRTKVGYATSDVYVYGDDGYLRQDFNWGEYGECCIIYDPQNAVGNDLATNEAYLLRTGFYDLYNTIEVGGSAGGCPTRDEYMSRDPQNWEDPTEYPLQNFFSRRDYLNNEVAQHYMIWKDDSASYHSAYTVSYISQTPSGQVNLFAGQTYQFEVQYRNTGTNSWYNTAEGHLNAYVELKSCDANGLKTNSFLNWPYDASLGWLNYESPTTMNEASVEPGQNATFTFTGKAPTNAAPGTYQVYFRPNHSRSGLLQGWGGMHFVVVVEDPATYACAYVSQNPSGQFDMIKGSQGTFTVSFRNTGNRTWYNNPSVYPNDYVELKSCDAAQNKTASFLNWPYDASLGWLNYESPTTMNEASVEPGGIATFTFTGKVAASASSGMHTVYFSPHHSVAEMLPGWGGMHYQVNVLDPPVYSCEYVSQSPAGQFNFGEGTSRIVEVKFRNTGNRTWRKNASIYPNDYVELKSCASNGLKTNSFFNWPYVSGQGWLNSESPCTFVESSVPPGSIGTFRFTARVNEGQSAGLKLVYFRPHHSVNGGTLLDGWGGMHFQANIPVSYSCQYVSQSPAGQFNMAAGTQRAFWVKFKNTGNTTWRNNPSSYPNDYVELKSSDGGSGLTASFLNWPYDASLGWLNYESPTTMSESSIGPGGTATFSFTGKVNGGTSPGLRLAYFRPNHSVNGGALLEDWGGMHYQVNVTASTAKLNDLGIPISFSLSQNYPNPFNPVTTISYTLPSATHVRLDIFNILGQNVQTLVNKHQTAGEHSVLWNSEKFSSGIYLYRLQTGEKTETKKMILLK